MALAGIELRYLVRQISEKAEGYYVSNIYGIARDSLLFKMHHTEKDDIFMMVSTLGIWITDVRVEQIEPNRMQRRLRGDLLRLKLVKIDQVGAERVAYITFSGFDKEFIMVVEFFGDGNIILCNDKMRILALQHSIDVRHRRLAVGAEYAAPPGGGPDVFDISEADFDAMAGSELAAAKWFGREFGLPKKYVEGIFGEAGIDPKGRADALSAQDKKKILDITRGTVSDVAEGRHDPHIADGEAVPVRLAASGQNCTRHESFMAALDAALTGVLVNRGQEMHSGQATRRRRELETQLEEQERAIGTVKEKSAGITRVANSLYSMVASGITSIEDERAAEMLGQNGGSLTSRRGVRHVSVGGEDIRINSDAPLQSIASILFDAAKKQSGAVGAIEQAMARTREKLDGITDATGGITVSEIRKKEWYERYRWFFTTDGLLAVGGRDAASNSAVIRKQLGRDDRVFHADVFGSPFFILKDCQDAPASSMGEVAHATVCFSRAWREGMYGTSAYWVNPMQVKKSAPSGQFLPKGSFTVEGQRNYIKVPALRLAVGIMEQDGGHILACGPPQAIMAGAACYAIIEPHGSEMAATAKKIRAEFSKIEEDIVKKIPIDDFVRALPAGTSQIREVGRGGK